MKELFNSLLLFVALLFMVEQVAGHSFLVFPPPRVNHAGATFGHKNSDPNLDQFWPRILDQGPTCRIANNNYPPPGQPRRSFMAGEIIPVTFNIRIPHPSPPGFVIAVWYSNRDPFQNNIIMADFNPPERDAYWGAGQYTFQVKLPDKPCQSCVFLWAWGSLKDKGFYLDCADIQITPQRAPNVPATLLPERMDSCFSLSKKTCEQTPSCRPLWGLAVVTTNEMVYLGCASTQNCNNNQKRQFFGGLGGLFGGGGGGGAPGGGGRFGPLFSGLGGGGNRPGGDFRSFGLAVDPKASGCPDRGCGQGPPRFTTRDPGVCIEPAGVPNNIHFIVDTCVTLDGYQRAQCPRGVGSNAMGAEAPLELSSSASSSAATTDSKSSGGGKDDTLTIVLISLGGAALLAAVILLGVVVYRKYSADKKHTPSNVVYF